MPANFDGFHLPVVGWRERIQPGRSLFHEDLFRRWRICRSYRIAVAGHHPRRHRRRVRTGEKKPAAGKSEAGQAERHQLPPFGLFFRRAEFPNWHQIHMVVYLSS
jgi:hypothetical protein